MATHCSSQDPTVAHPAWAVGTQTTALPKQHPSKTRTQTSLGVQPRSLPQDPCLESLLQLPQKRALWDLYTSLYKGPAWSTQGHTQDPRHTIQV